MPGRRFNELGEQMELVVELRSRLQQEQQRLLAMLARLRCQYTVKKEQLLLSPHQHRCSTASSSSLSASPFPTSGSSSAASPLPPSHLAAAEASFAASYELVGRKKEEEEARFPETSTPKGSPAHFKAAEEHSNNDSNSNDDNDEEDFMSVKEDAEMESLGATANWRLPARLNSLLTWPRVGSEWSLLPAHCGDEVSPTPQAVASVINLHQSPLRYVSPPGSVSGEVPEQQQLFLREADSLSQPLTAASSLYQLPTPGKVPQSVTAASSFHQPHLAAGSLQLPLKASGDLRQLPAPVCSLPQPAHNSLLEAAVPERLLPHPLASFFGAAAAATSGGSLSPAAFITGRLHQMEAVSRSGRPAAMDDSRIFISRQARSNSDVDGSSSSSCGTAGSSSSSCMSLSKQQLHQPRGGLSSNISTRREFRHKLSRPPFTYVSLIRQVGSGDNMNGVGGWVGGRVGQRSTFSFTKFKNPGKGTGKTGYKQGKYSRHFSVNKSPIFSDLTKSIKGKGFYFILHLMIYS
jgi:hypothetical protein